MRNLRSLLKLILIISVSTWLTACGGSGGRVQGIVEITDALRCAPNVGWATTGYLFIPTNCEVVQIVGGSYETDQNTIHLAGFSFEAEDDGCPEPTIFGQPCIPRPIGYDVIWKNMTNGASGSGSEGAGINIIVWNTFNAVETSLSLANLTGIPLNMGPNTIRISAEDSGSIGIAEITVTRVVDVTPPTVHHVDPEPGGTYGFRIVVYFSEQLDPASVVRAINVFDNNAQSIPGTSEFNPLKLEATWQPQAALSPASSYTARISGVTDWAPNVMIDPYEWSFTTRP